MKEIKRADILIPAQADLEKWSVIACDQFTSSPDYWEETECSVGQAPSTLRMILPEAYLGTEKEWDSPRKTAGKMNEYLKEGVFRTVENAFIYVERTTQSGKTRHGILAAVDLEAYDYRPQVEAGIKATEKTVEERLWKRLEVRRNASLELPHILVFYDDPEELIAGELEKARQQMTKEYDFNLMMGGGHLTGYSITGENAERLEDKLAQLKERKHAGGRNPGGAVYAVGDGNHSLATAKLNWDELKKTISEEERENHPARYALAELVNVYDEGVEIFPIHRILKGTMNEEFISFCRDWYHEHGKQGTEKTVGLGTPGERVTVRVTGLSTGELVGETDHMLSAYMQKYGGEEDYIHDDDTAVELGSGKGCAYVLLPTVERKEIFETVEQKRIFPKKCFSIGNAKDKRYYLECRKIVKE